MEQLYAALIASAISLIGALVAYFVSYLNNKKVKEKLQTLEDFINSDDTEYYIECPNCKSKIILNKVKILVSKQTDK